MRRETNLCLHFAQRLYLCIHLRKCLFKRMLNYILLRAQGRKPAHVDVNILHIVKADDNEVEVKSM